MFPFLQYFLKAAVSGCLRCTLVAGSLAAATKRQPHKKPEMAVKQYGKDKSEKRNFAEKEKNYPFDNPIIKYFLYLCIFKYAGRQARPRLLIIEKQIYYE